MKKIIITCAECRHNDKNVRLSEKIHDLLDSTFGAGKAYCLRYPGPDGIVPRGKDAHRETMRDNISVLLEKGHAEIIALVGHEDCAGNEVGVKQHSLDISASCDEIARATGVPVIGLFARRITDDDWQLAEICQMRAESPGQTTMA